MNEEKVILSVRKLCKYFPVYSRGLIKKTLAEVRAVNNVSFDLLSGDTLGLVGESGCGKTTTCRTILRALMPTSGKVLFRPDGELVDLALLHHNQLRSLRPHMQMIFQDPFSSLNPRMTVGDIVGEPLVIHKLARPAGTREHVAEMLHRVGLRARDAERYPHEFSGGQRQRIGIARALIMKPSLVVCDEAVSALDVSVQAQIINLLQDLQEQLDLTYIFVAHDLSVVKHICSHIAVMYAGRIVEQGPAQSLFQNPKHPYTIALFSAIPCPDVDKPIKVQLSGEPADLANLPAGCSFHPRCPRCFDACPQSRPELVDVGGDHHVACHLHPATE